MPIGVTTPTIVKAGALEADNINILNTALSAANTSPGVVGTSINSVQPFGNYTTAGTAVTLVATGAPAGTYRVSVFGVITTTFTGSTAITHTVGWTDDQGAHTNLINNFTTITAGQQLSGVIVLRSTGAAAITLTEVGTVSNATGGAMALSAFTERLA